jgi:RING-like zinc finger
MLLDQVIINLSLAETVSWNHRNRSCDKHLYKDTKFYAYWHNKSAPSRSRTMNNCQHTTLKGSPCPYTARHCYEGLYVCRIHLKYMKSREDCPLCLDEMTNSHDRFKLTCGHYFHKTCLECCYKAECPICKAPFAPIDAMFVYVDTISNPLMFDVFSTPHSCPPTILDLYNKIINITKRWQNGLFSLYYIASIYEHVGGAYSSLNDAIKIFERAILYVKQHQTLNGFSVYCQDNRIEFP